MRIDCRALGLFLAVSVVLSAPAVAQEPSIEVTQDGGARRISAGACYVEPMPVEDLIGLLGLDGGGIDPVPPMIVTSPLGTRADDATTGRITSAVRGLIACINAGDVPRTAAWMTAHGVQRVYGTLATDSTARVDAQRLLTARPAVRTREDSLRLLAISDVSTLPDGRVAAFTVFNDPARPPGGPETALVVYSSRTGGWLLDDWVDFSIVPTAPPKA